PADRSKNHHNFHVRGYKEEGTVTTPFDMVMRNDLDRFHLVIDVIDRVPSLGARAAALRQEMTDRRLKARACAREYGEDPQDVRDWTWPVHRPVPRSRPAPGGPPEVPRNRTASFPVPSHGRQIRRGNLASSLILAALVRDR